MLGHRGSKAKSCQLLGIWIPRGERCEQLIKVFLDLHMVSRVLRKMPRTNNREGTVFSINGIGKNRLSIYKRIKIDYLLLTFDIWIIMDCNLSLCRFLCIHVVWCSMGFWDLDLFFPPLREVFSHYILNKLSVLPFFLIFCHSYMSVVLLDCTRGKKFEGMLGYKVW